MKVNYDRFEELVLYIAQKSENDPHFGKTKLNKILFAIDFFAYGVAGYSMTGDEYIHLKNGPAPKSILTVFDKLKEENRAEFKEVDRFGYTQQRLIALSNANVSFFSKQELDFVDYWINYFKSLSGTDLSEWTHKQNPWLLTVEGETIPYESVFVLKDLPIEKDVILWAENEVEKMLKAG